MDADESKILIKVAQIIICILRVQSVPLERRKIGSLEQCTVKPTLVMAQTYYGTAILIINKCFYY